MKTGYIIHARARAYAPHTARPSPCKPPCKTQSTPEPVVGQRQSSTCSPRGVGEAPHFCAQMVDAAFHLAFVVRENIGRKCKRGDIPSPATMRLDRIRNALVRLDEISKDRI